MQNSLIYSSSALCKTEPEESLGSKALDVLKEKIKIFELEKIPYLSHSQKKKMADKQRSKSQKYQIHPKVKQPQQHSQNRISNKEQPISSQNRFSMQILESVKSRLSIQEAKLMDVPIVKVSRERVLSSKKESENNISLILMEKYYQSTIKYEEKQLKQTTKTNQPKHTSKLMINNQAVKNFQRKIKNSRRELLKELNTSINDQQQNIQQPQLKSIAAEGSNLQEKNNIKYRPIKTVYLKRNYSTSS
ncbi:unnamed protein product [Paramecium pentaurelia]|uniref:Uncharacterized protein n=1 Tax=Paramecium pentaurelia TaxID=43138 RepID=A0A8S1WSV2_9CILI|nr:unnamed protein product [Paramecium pentaurelia]